MFATGGDAVVQVCQRCGMPVRHGFKFCNVCGEPYAEETNPIEDVVLYSPYLGYKGRVVRCLSGADAGRFYDACPILTFGRENADISIGGDPTVSPAHARIEVGEKEMFIKDTGALNGVFLKVHDKIVLSDNDIIRAGDHYFLYEEIEIEAFSEESGTDFYASPLRGESFRLVEILSGGRCGRAMVSDDDAVSVGRTEGNFTFPGDEKMSGLHFSIKHSQRGTVLSDSSVNGTFVQIHDSTPIEQGDIFFIGDTLFCMY